MSIDGVGSSSFLNPNAPVKSIFDIDAYALEQIAQWLDQRGVQTPISQIPGYVPGQPRITAQTIATGAPDNPSDGDIWIGTSAGVSGEVWAFRYNSGSASTYKWEFIGGSPVAVRVYTSPTSYTADSTPKLDTTLGTMTTALAGEYQLSSSSWGHNSASGAQTAGSGYMVNGTAGGVLAEFPGAASASWTLTFDYWITAAAGDVYGLWHQTNGTGSFTVSRRFLAVVPVRV